MADMINPTLYGFHMRTIYVETSIFSYLTARPTRNIIASARQKITREWWIHRRSYFQLFISPLVNLEATRGDVEASIRRVEAMRGFAVLELVKDALELANALVKKSALPANAGDDALHIALAAVHQMNYILTWNCRHIDNAETKPVIRKICTKHGFRCPEICTPEELMGERDES